LKNLGRCGEEALPHLKKISAFDIIVVAITLVTCAVAYIGGGFKSPPKLFVGTALIQIYLINVSTKNQQRNTG